MVLCTLHLISLTPTVPLAAFLSHLRQHHVTPVVQARVCRWMVLPAHLSAGDLLARNVRWDVLLILECGGGGGGGNGTIPPAVADSDVAASWTATCGVSAGMLSSYASVNAGLLRPAPGTVTPAEAVSSSTKGQSGRTAGSSSPSSSRNLEMTPELERWIAVLPGSLRRHPVSMLNLLAFNEGKREQYKQYGAAFSARVGSRHGGRVKIVGKVVGGEGTDAGADGWDEIAFVHYPSVEHFAAMASSADYQEVNRQYRLGALKDTFIICVMEVDDQGEVVDASRAGRERL